ncbi:type II toxin-antitoxin system RelE/ParE family toxin [Phytoactinopolyspora endophytica]|uniref:type II toxin-antitoxin system RelE/ParE family toxin n=1 Tax=Phytoactinopolyspora endophytica TaxID=1642495 RepID=UPI00101CAFAA
MVGFASPARLRPTHRRSNNKGVIVNPEWVVRFVDEAAQERSFLPPPERQALANAVAKLEVMGPGLGFPHTSSVRGCPGVRELRPRAGRSPWRALYKRCGDTFVIASVGSEAESDPRGFDRAVRNAVVRLSVTREE